MVPADLTVLPAAAALLCVVFAALLFLQWRARRRPYQLVWAFGLLCYGVASAADATGQLFGWNTALYRTWYLFGAIGAAAWLGLGELYLMRTSAFGELVALGVFAGAIPAFITGGHLLGVHDDGAAYAAIAIGMAGVVAAGALALVSWERPQWLGHAALLMLVAGSLSACVKILITPVDTGQMLDPATGIPHGMALPQSIRLVTPLFNIGGALALAFGAAYSAWVFWRRRTHRQRVVSNTIIALGALVPTLSSSLNRFGVTTVFYWGELLGVLLIFAGFLVSTEVFARR